MNKVMLVGNIVKDADLKTVGENGTFKGTFTLACNERVGEGKELVNFVPCTIWGKMAEALTPYLVKGNKVAVSGRLDIKNVESEEFEDEWKTYVTINVSELDFCGGKKETFSGDTSKPKKTEKKKKKNF